MSIDDVERLYKYWRMHPPTHLLAAAFMKFEPPNDDEEKGIMSLEEFQMMIDRSKGKLLGR